MNAIFKANGMSETCLDGAVRLFKDYGAQLDPTLGQVNQFTVIEIDGDKILQYGIMIKRATTDSEYISKLTNSSNYEIYEAKIVDISGEEVEYIAP